jgi:glyoxylase-like metal-dependent hydrolase (beta-lactamase superfamily II)
MELKKLKNDVYYIPNRTNIGVIKDGSSAILIDTGLDDDTGKRILKVLEENGLSVDAIINTHSHADHCGGNAFIKGKTGAKIYAPEFESGIIEHPYFEPFYLFSGAEPIEELKNKFLMAQASRVDYVIGKDEKMIKIGNTELHVVSLKGHSPNQIGVESDGVLFCADSVFSEEMVNKHKIPFYIDIDEAKRTMEWLKVSEYQYYVPSHAEPTPDISDLLNVNMSTIFDVERVILGDSNERRTTEEVFGDTCRHYDLDVGNAHQYFLMNTVIMAYLSSLSKSRKLRATVTDNSLHWEKT